MKSPINILNVNFLQSGLSAFVVFLLLVEGAALMAVELMGAKLLAPFYGSSLYVWTTVLSITVLGLALGYALGGLLSNQQAASKFLIPVLITAAIWVLLLPQIAGVVILVTSGLALVPGVLLASIGLLVLPMLCFGMVGPMIVGLLSVETEKKGSVAGNVYFISTLGGVVATFAAGFYTIPEMGLISTSRWVSFVLFCIPVLHVLISLGRKGNNILPKEDIVVDPTPNKQPKLKSTEAIQRSVYLYAVVEGAAVMAVELLSARMLAPYFGASLYVWATVIGLTLIGLAIGYFAGGKIADKHIGLNTLHWVLLSAAVFLMCMHFSAQYLTEAFRDASLQNALILVSVWLIVPPLVLLGMVPTLVIRYFKKGKAEAGQTTGYVFTLSSVSGIVALFLLGFYIIPQYGLTAPSLIIGGLVGLIPFARLMLQQKYISLLFLLFMGVSLSQRNPAIASPDVKVLHFSEGILGQVIVADVFKNGKGEARNDRMLFVNRMGQTSIDERTGQSNWPYIPFATAVCSKVPVGGKALLLGLGGGSLANSLTNQLQLEVDAIELDNRIATIAGKYFGLNPEVNILIDDARHYLETTSQSYDLIFFDVFKGDVIPPHVLSLECFTRARSLLTKDGMIVVNFNGFLNGETGAAGRSVYATLMAAGFKVKLLPTPGDETQRNMLFVATQQRYDYSLLRSPLRFRGQEVKMDSLFEAPPLNEGIILVDDKPVLDRMNIEAGTSWRIQYNDGLTRFFTATGIPLFK